MKLAVLFWFYKEFDICRNRLEILRLHSPDCRIYGLYGGSSCDAEDARRQLSWLMDDMYVFTGSQDPDWRWRNGDLLLADWHKHRGYQLPWDSIVVVQWDMLVLGAIELEFGMVKRNEILLSGLRPVSEVKNWWPWVNRPDLLQDFESFVSYLNESYGFTEDPLCCLFIVACLSRRFMGLYVESGPPAVGFIEYRVPTMAKVLGVAFCTHHGFRPWWAAHPRARWVPQSRRLLKAVGNDVPREVVVKAARTGRAKIFHPYRSLFPLDLARSIADGR